MLPIDPRTLSATYYAANLHKWCDVPKTAAILYVRRDRQPDVHPLVIGHGANSPRTPRRPVHPMLGAMATLPLPATASMSAPVLIYNDLQQYQHLADAIRSELR